MSRHFKAGDLTVGPHKPSIIGADVVKVLLKEFIKLGSSAAWTSEGAGSLS